MQQVQKCLVFPLILFIGIIFDLIVSSIEPISPYLQEVILYHSDYTPNLYVYGDDGVVFNDNNININQRKLAKNLRDMIWHGKNIKVGNGSYAEPDLTHQSVEEKNYLALHKCRDTGEAYSASYLITKEYLLERNTDYNLTWVNCEMGSFIMMAGRADPHKLNISGTVIQSLDVLDFSVIHLSAYERLQRRWYTTIKKHIHSKLIRTDIDAIINSTNLLKYIALEKINLGIQPTNYFHRTVVIMPFLGSDMGAGHSKLTNRLQYLHSCFWSFYTYTPNVVAFVLNQKDYEYARNISELPWYDVVLLKNLPKSASLPVASVQQTKYRLEHKIWDFDYVFFTESDQILMFRIPDIIYQHLKQYPNRLISPHRLMPYPEQVLRYRWNRIVNTSLTPFDWEKMNCCIARQNCGDRKSWISLGNDSVVILNVFGLWTPLGNANFHEEKYRTCRLNPKGDWPYCP